MVLKFKDCIDVLKVLYPEYDCMFLFYHSCGHDRKRPDGLCVSSTRKEFGGKQTVMRDSKMEPEEYLRQFGGLLSVGTSQRMYFVPSDAGPYWMTDAEKHSNRKDVWNDLVCSISSLLLCNNSVTSIDNTQLSLYLGYKRKVSYSHYSHIQLYKCIRVLCSSGSLCSSSHVCPTG
jgi:hypothetical protein